MKEITMPSFGSDMEQGVLTEWLVKPGDQVKRGDSLAVIETHKGAIELDAFDEGTIAKLLIEVGQKTPVGTPIALLRQVGDSVESDTIEALEQPEPSPTPLVEATASAGSELTAQQLRGQNPPPMPSTNSLSSNYQPVSPVARRLAEENNLALNLVTGTGPHGAIRLIDVERALIASSSSETAPAQAGVAAPVISSATSNQGESRVKSGFDPQAMRDAITATVTRSKREIPHYYLTHTLDISALQSYLQQQNAQREPEQRILLIAVMLRAIAISLGRFGQLNGHYQEEFVPAEPINIANAVNLRGGGLVMPVLKEVERCSLDELMTQLQGVVSRAKAGALKYSDLENPTFTVTSIGERGVDSIFGVIYPPQVAIVGLGCPRDVAVVEAGEVVIRTIITATLSADHRVTDGHYGSRFLCDINKRLQQPEALWNAKN
jgi:pyruvate dehydrogenase E2 component (dihydrolipoamide acetyltransferase)